MKGENPTQTTSLHPVPTAVAVLNGPRFPIHVSTTCCKAIEMRYSTLACHAISSPSKLPGQHNCTVSVWWCLSYSWCDFCCQDLGPIWTNSQQWISRTCKQDLGLALWCCFSLFQSARDLEDILLMLYNKGVRAKTKLLLHLALLQHWSTYSII